MANGENPKNDSESDVLVEDQIDVPKSFSVILHNDDYTTMEFVIEVLTTVFKHSLEQAERIMIAIHKKGQGVAGVYRKEIAEMKCALTQQLARSRGFPLRASVEEDLS